MITEALKYINSLSTRVEKVNDMFGHELIITQNGIKTTIEPTIKDTFNVISLQGIVDYIKNDVDGLYLDICQYKKLTIHIQDVDKVVLYQELNTDLERVKLVIATAIVPRLQFDQFIDAESMIINLMANYIPDNEVADIIQILSTINIESGVQSSDNGLTQSVVTKKGLSLNESKTLKPRVRLTPIRSFVEVEQVPSDFIFRMKTQNEKAYAALFEADGKLWKIATMNNIKKYFQNELETVNLKYKDAGIHEVSHDVNIMM